MASRNAEKRDVRLSKKLTYFLRHGAEAKGLHMDAAGFVRVDELLRHPGLAALDVGKLREIVAQDRKQRFALSGEGPGLMVRANQGHTVSAVKDGALLTPLTAADVARFPVVVHGTQRRFWKPIEQTGLCRMARNHIHFATGLPRDGVISGMRTSSKVLIFLNLEAAIADGIPFFVSANGVILSPGLTDKGIIPPKYFQRVEHL